MNTSASVIEKKSEIVRILFEIDNENIVTELFEYALNLIKTDKKFPCQYTDEEILQRIEESEKQFEAGEIITLEELEKKYQ